MRAAALSLVVLSSVAADHAMVASAPPRPALLTSAAPSDTVYYFGVGSNMLRSKLLNRGLNGSAIEVIGMGPAVVAGHRLAFNLRGFPPLEPGMGALEPAAPAAACHGALCSMRRDQYEKVWLSEGGGSPKPGYEEIVVEATAYGAERPVLAIALRARPHARLAADACPSERYMGILLEGANELGLAPAYVAELEAVVPQRVGPLLRCLAVHHFFLASALFRLKQAQLVSWYSKALFAVYVPSSGDSGLGPRLRRMLSAVATAALLAPTALIGAAIRLADAARGKPPPPMLAALMARSSARVGRGSVAAARAEA